MKIAEIMIFRTTQAEPPSLKKGGVFALRKLH